MKKLTGLVVLFVAMLMVFAPRVANAQGTAFTYQGFLLDNAAPANGSYDLQFSLFGSATDGVALTAPVAVEDLNVTNGLFTTVLDFGAAQFTGAARWVEIGVRPGASTGGYTALVPRQPITPVPYAVFAGGVSAAGITGTIPAGNIGSATITSNMLAPGAAAANLGTAGATILSLNPNATNLTAAGYARIGGQLDLAWQERPAPSAPSARGSHTAVWTGSRMLVWGGVSGSQSGLGAGGIYDPAGNNWSALATNDAPTARTAHTAVWTGNDMIVWGGLDSARVETGSRFNLGSGIWSPMTTSNAPIARSDHTAVWTGSAMIVWGGVGNGGVFPTQGARYDTVTDNWVLISTNGAPMGRAIHTAVWTGTEMIVWGGGAGVQQFNDGARYNPNTDSWAPVTTNGAPSARYQHTAVWTGTEMIVWGGNERVGNQFLILSDGARYNPTTDTWSSISVSNGPSARFAHTAVWTGDEMLVWGGCAGTSWLKTGGRYSPGNDK